MSSTCKYSLHCVLGLIQGEQVRCILQSAACGEEHLEGKTHSLEYFSQQGAGTTLLPSSPGAQTRDGVISLQLLEINMIPGNNPEQKHGKAFVISMGHGFRHGPLKSLVPGHHHGPQKAGYSH